MGILTIKVTNWEGKNCIPSLFYREMPIGITGDGKTIYTSARDIGNIAAGYVAGVNGLSYLTARFGFDGYQSITDDKISIECKSTRNAEHYGWNLGYYNTSQVKQTYNLVRSGCFAELWLFNEILNHFR